MLTAFFVLALLAANTSALNPAFPADVSAAPPPSTVRVPFTKRINYDSLRRIADRDRARVRNFVHVVANKRSLKERAIVPVPVTNEAVSYIATVGVGSPETKYSLIVDTGSSNTWIGAGTPFTRTKTTKELNDTAAVQYGSGSFQGRQVLDQVDLGASLVIPNQSISVASSSSGFNGVDGILGLGPTDLTVGTVSNENSIPTVTDNLFSLGIISGHVVSASFSPTNKTSEVDGELIFGGVDTKAFVGSITTVAVTSTKPSNVFFGIDASFVQSGKTILRSAGIVDTGTTLTLLASDAFATYKKASGANLDNATGLLRLTRNQFANLPTLNVVVGGVSFPLTPDAQRWPQQLNTEIGGDNNSVYLIVNDLGSPSGQGLDFILGQTFLERFYSVYDSTGSGFVGLAKTKFTNVTVNN